jgi:nitrogen fixation protein NifU and related proteins
MPAGAARDPGSLPFFSAAMPSEEELYQDHILDHYEDPFHRGRLADATHAHEDKNPLCGDVVRMELAIDDGGKIRNVYFDGQGCVISQASASMLSEEMYGKTVDAVKHFSAEDMLKLYGPRLTPNRQKCCLLSWKVLQSAVHSPLENQKA